MTESVSVRIDPASTEFGFESTELELWVKDAADGIGVYDLTVAVGEPDIVEITDLTPTQGDDETVTVEIADDGSTASIEAALLDETYEPGGHAVATLTVEGLSLGETSLSYTEAAVGDTNGYQYSIAETSGSTLTVSSDVELVPVWEGPVELPAELQFTRPVMGDSHLYLGGLDEQVRRIDPEEASLEDWAYERDGSLADGAPVVLEDSVIVAGGGGTVARIDSTVADPTDPAAIEWTYDAGSAVVATPTVVDGTVIAASTDGRVHAVDLDDGEPVDAWDGPLELGAPVYADLANGAGLIVLALRDGRIVTLEAADGEIAWEHQTDHAFVASAPVIAEDRIYVAGRTLLAFELESTRNLVWEKTAYEGTAGARPLVDGDRIYAADETGELVAFEHQDESVEGPLWSVAVGEKIVADPMVVGESILACSRDGELTLVDPDGNTLATNAVDGIVRGGLVTADSTVYFGTEDPDATPPVSQLRAFEVTSE